MAVFSEEASGFMVDPALVVPVPGGEDPGVVGCSVRSLIMVSKPGVSSFVTREDLAAYSASRGMVAAGEWAPGMLVEGACSGW